MGFETREISTYEGEPVECIEITHGASQWLYTTSDQEIELPGIGTFTPSPGVHVGGQNFEDEDHKGKLEIEVPRTSDIAGLYIGHAPPEKTWVRVYRTHRGETDPICLFFGWVDRVPFRKSTATLECASILNALARRIPGYAYTYQCSHTLYGPLCRANPDDFAWPETVDSVDGSAVTAEDWQHQGDGYLTGGYIQLADGTRRMIVDHVGPTITLIAPIPGLAAGDTVTAFPGCDHNLDTCINKFLNGNNFMGFLAIPYRDPHSQRLQ